jgi:O-antigen ligase
MLSGFVTMMTFLSLSSAALLAAGLQIGIILWGRITGKAWRTLAILAVVGYVAIDLASNRTPITILISHLTFSQQNSWARILIWEYGIAEVWRHPIFGIGLNEWQRGWGVPLSVDNFWLLTAMRYGIPAFILLALGIVYNILKIIGSDIDGDRARYRLGYVIASIATIMTLCTVHIWGGASVFIMFYIGAGVWFFNEKPAPVAHGQPLGEGDSRIRPRREARRTASPARPSRRAQARLR